MLLKSFSPQLSSFPVPILEQDNTGFAIWLGKGQQHLVSKYRGRCPVSLLTTHHRDAFALLHISSGARHAQIIQYGQDLLMPEC